ncbi:hypothetical protein [Nodosilinea sp. P-1105]|uniref:hypothetical protein n=1 Tax=Nodosilinea sp. P-1105 TaxID=2546229 RepID=UPI00146F7DAD|nr:hypothetical protein [Nodosilinea sp. P-1105]NMF82914.1 hypothetical protein [Nodosilinea sp. P-1105]
MIISKPTDPSLGNISLTSSPLAKPDDLSRFQGIIDRATATGRLTRQDEDQILAALVNGRQPAPEKCALFRQMQERVWQAELHLD